jgi:tRNA (cmo5U34)-methyltransferase
MVIAIPYRRDIAILSECISPGRCRRRRKERKRRGHLADDISIMTTALENKSTTTEIRARFDHDVERFSCLETGQQATIDAVLVLELVAQMSAMHLRPGDTLLDIGCGAGNFTLRILREVSPLECHLVDLSQPMLTRAEERIHQIGVASVHSYQGDFRTLPFGDSSFDCILAGAVLHHLRDEKDWQVAFKRFHSWLRPNGRIYVSDLVYFEVPDAQQIMWKRYGEYLESLGGKEFRAKVFAYIDKEDSPRSLPFQLDLLKATGFSNYDILHRNSVFACYFGVK